MLQSSNSFLDVGLITELREKESKLAARFLNAHHFSLGEPDIPLRYIDANQYSVQTIDKVRVEAGGYMRMPPPYSLVEEISALLWENIQPLAPDEIWFPLGVGNHFDHRLTRDACLHMITTQWAVFREKRVLLYEDLPYAWEDAQSAEKLVDLLRQNGAKLERLPVNITAVFEDKINCLKIYASQWKISKLRPKIEEPARDAMSNSQGYAEALWRLSKPPSVPFTPLITVKGMSQVCFENAARRLFECRTEIQYLSILISHAVGRWSDHGRFILDLFPNALVDVLAFHQNKDQFMGFDNRRIRLSFFHETPASVFFRLLKWSCRINHTVLVFGGTRRIKEANWLRRILLTRHAYAFETFEDLCALWRHWFSKMERENRV